jgi:TonB family protein
MIGANQFDSAAMFLLACSVKATFLLGAAWFIARMTQRFSAVFRHTIWATAVLGTLLLPILVVVMPAWHSTALGNAAAIWSRGQSAAVSGSTANMPVTIVDAVLTAPATGRWAALLLILWGIGFLVFVVRMVEGLLGLARVAAHSEPLSDEDWQRRATEICRLMKIKRRVWLLQSAQATAMPVTWGALQPAILLPASAVSWPDTRKRSVLSHEIAHIARLDWLFQMFAETARAIYWFHPLAWIAAGRMRRESECACDDSALNSGIEAANYANDLLDLARTLENPSRNWSAALAVASPTNLERRFSAMLNPLTDRRNLSRSVRARMVLVAMLVLLPLAAVRLPAQNGAGKFGGIISDPSGMPIANATVIMNNHKANLIQMTTSDAEGRYGFVSLPAGEYELRVMKPGFAEFRATVAAPDSGHDATQNLTLQVGSVNEEIDVIAAGGPKGGVSGGVSGEVNGGVNGGVNGRVTLQGPAKTIRVRIGGEVQAPKLIEKVPPVYPAKAKAAGIEGTVILHAIIGMEGNPLSLRVMNNQIDPDLARAAVEAVSKWRYRPTLLNGEPIEVDTTIIVNFKLLP